MADKPKTLSELLDLVEKSLQHPFPVPEGHSYESLRIDLLIATAKAVQELWEHQHQILSEPDMHSGHQYPIEDTTKPIGYGSKK